MQLTPAQRNQASSLVKNKNPKNYTAAEKTLVGTALREATSALTGYVKDKAAGAKKTAQKAEGANKMQGPKA